MTKRKELLSVLLIAMATLSFGGTPKLISDPTTSLRTWTVRMSARIEGWAIYRDGPSVCILKKDGTTIANKTSQLSFEDQRYLTANPPQGKTVFDPEEERIALNNEIDDLSNRLAALEAARKRGTFQGITDTEGVMGTFQGSYSEGPSRSRIEKISLALIERRAKLAALKAAFRLKEAQKPVLQN